MDEEAIVGAIDAAGRTTHVLQARAESGWKDLLLRCASRDQAALAALYDQSSSLIYTIALRVLNDPADAAEVVVDVYHQVWGSADKFDDRRGSAAAWLVTIARSRAMDRRRSRAARIRLEVQLDQAPQLASHTPDPESLTATARDRSSVERELRELPAGQRRALELAFFEGLTHPEIADLLGEPLGTVKTRIRLAVSKLRKRLHGVVSIM
jgi:RNA polymerase sigma-70 factor (ECF subfamily)